MQDEQRNALVALFRTALDRTHHLQLVEARMPAVDFTLSVIAEDVRDLQSWSSHGRRRYGAGDSSVSRLARQSLRAAMSSIMR
jgi:hypothetical protein